MSRIIVKQLPKTINEEKLRNIFGSKGSITDIQLKYTRDGKFRQFGFIGYQSEVEAQEAIKYLNNTCIQTNRIKVELCAALGSEEKPQSWSKYAKDSKVNALKNDKTTSVEKIAPTAQKPSIAALKVDEILGTHKDDPEFQEFIKAHDKNRTLWANDAGDAEKESFVAAPVAENHDDKTAVASESCDNEVEEEDQKDDDEKLAVKPISDLEYMKSLVSKKSNSNAEAKKAKSGIDLYTIKIHNVPYQTKRQDILKFFKPLKPYSVRLPSKVHGFCYVGFKTEKEMAKAMLKNKSFIKGKQVFFADFTEKNKITKSKLKGSNDKESEAPQTNAKWQQQTNDLLNEENVSESGCIFFRNLAYTTTEDDLQKLFEQFGPIAEISLPVDVVTRQIKGFGTVTYVMPEHAVIAFNKLDGTDFHGRLLHLIPGKDKKLKAELNENDEALSFKQKKAMKMKKNAQRAVTWNTLFMGANAVAELLSKQFKVSKETLLDTNKGGSNAAVRLALGETQIVVEMKRFLEEHGVHLDAFETPDAKRSKTVLLAKNLPAETTVAELTPIFAKFGPIGRLILPPSGVTALIEYCDASEARQAFKKLAFSKFKSLPLYLEWAPEHVFTSTLSDAPTIPKQEADTNEKETQNPFKEQIPKKEEEDVAEDADDEPEPNTTLFMRNLHFNTIPETIIKHFQKLGTVHTVELAKRKDTQNPQQQVSLGYGFIQFKKAVAAENALKKMQCSHIDGNIVELKRSDRELRKRTEKPMAERKQIKETKQTGTKILVRNIPFQAQQREVRDIFKAFGELRSVRLPKKMVPGEESHRGFAFIDYVTKGDAKKAFEALSPSTHLYGRRLVLEWASTTDDDVDVLRKRTATHFSNSLRAEEHSGKRSHRAIFDIDGNMQKVAAENSDDEE